MEKKYKIVIPLDLQMFAKEGPGGEKTEDATSKHLDDVREEGNVAKSKEVETAAMLLALFLCLRVMMGFIGNRLLGVFSQFYTMIPEIADSGLGNNEFSRLFVKGILNLLIPVLPFLLVGFVVAFFSTSLQFKFKVTKKPLEPKFSKMNPINGIKRMFSLNTLMELLKAVLKVSVISYLVYNVLMDHAKDLFLVYNLTVQQSIMLMYDIVLELGMKICIFFIFLAVADLIYQRWKYKQDNKMTKQEVKDEYKNQEGDPKVKGQQKQRMMQASQRRMMAAIPEADVVITNPTHFAVALSYESGKGAAPIVVAKGADFLAAKIKDVAKENHIDIVENKPLARMLYHNVELGAEIPPELYQAVAEVLAYVYQLHNKVG